MNKMSGIPVKNHGKKQKVFLRKPSQIRVKLYENKWKTFLASWKRSELDAGWKDENKNWVPLVNTA